MAHTRADAPAAFSTTLHPKLSIHPSTFKPWQVRTEAAKRVLLKEVFAMAALAGVQVHPAPPTLHPEP